MEIRSITLFWHPGYPVNRLMLQKIGVFARHAKVVFEQAGYPVQTIRLATPSFTSYLPSDNLVVGAQRLMFEAHGEGFDYVSIGPALSNTPSAYHAIPDILASTKDLFVSGLTTTPNGEVSLEAVRACAKVIKEASSITPDGFTNLRFSALANVPAFTPFFPAAYSQGLEVSYGLALEAADLAVHAFSQADSLDQARRTFVEAVEQHARQLEAVASHLAGIYPIVFKGLDFGISPFPSPEKSVGNALEKLGLPAFGLHGSLAASAFLTDSLDHAAFKRTGFNGLMLAVLEDSTLGQRAAEGTYSVSDLLMCSAVCGTGLDVIPLPGDTSVDQLAAAILDVSALALRLNKPLTARLMPLPGKAAGDAVQFDFAYFTPTRVMHLNAGRLNGLLGGIENISINTRQGRPEQ